MPEKKIPEARRLPDETDQEYDMRTWGRRIQTLKGLSFFCDKCQNPDKQKSCERCSSRVTIPIGYRNKEENLPEGYSWD